MREKTKLRVIQILCIVSLLITVFSIQMTYAKYYEQIGTSYSTNIKRWVVNLNGSDIRTGVPLSQIMTPEFVENEYMNSNDTLVPGREGYFEFEINYEKVDVPFKYQFNIQQLNTAQLTDFQIFQYSIVDGEDETKTAITINNLSEITQNIDPDDENDLNSDGEKNRIIRVWFRWYDGSVEGVAESMDNAADTSFMGEGNTVTEADDIHSYLRYNVIVTFTQTYER